MKPFAGVPAGKVTVTPIPNLFFTELIPAIDDLAELKTILHIFWLVANNKQQHVRLNDLRADRTLLQSLAIDGRKPEEELTRALDAAVSRGALLKLSSDDDFYFVNNESGRRTYEQIEKEEQPRRSTIVELADARERPNIFALYEQNIGPLTPMIVEELKDAEKEYPGDWIEQAIKLAVENSVHKWSYARKILERWRTDGRQVDSKKDKAWWQGEHAKHINR
jgi:DnaD/phage-associated family protein